MGERGKDRWDADVRGVGGGYESRKAETVGKRGREEALTLISIR